MNQPEPPQKNTLGNILIVDDDKFLLNMYSQKFEKGGYRAEGCLSAAEALNVLRNGFDPDAILFDLTMPEEDGFAFLRSLAEEHLGERAVKIAVTNQNLETEKEKARELGASHYIVKASTIPSEVVNMVGGFLSEKRSGD